MAHGRWRRSRVVGIGGDDEWGGAVGFWPRRVGEEFGWVGHGSVQSGCTAAMGQDR
jgi:hypothetical protein